MNKLWAGILGAVIAFAIFVAGILCGIGYSMNKQWIGYSLFNQQLGEASEYFIALGMLDGTTPDQAREYLSKMLAYKVISLDTTLPHTGFDQENIGSGIIANIARHNEKYPLVIDDPDLKAKVDEILAKAKKDE